MRLLSAALVALIACSAAAETILSAHFTDPTKRYGHAVLGDAIEYGALEIRTRADGGETDRPGKTIHVLRLPTDHVFEDIAPRLVDVTGDGTPEVIVVETDMALGAASAIYTPAGKLAETPHIGQTNRWLAPIAAADLDGDGHIELAYIDRPHLAKTLRIWRYKNGTLREVATAPGLTNHKIGWDFIAGGLRLCGPVPELITANADWSRIIATRFDGHAITSSDIGAYDGPQSLETALVCR
ncbi:MAG: FG-GAP repeat domain-containing protein [Roseovarius sp.]